MSRPLPAPVSRTLPDLECLKEDVEQTLYGFLTRKAESATPGGRLPNLAAPLQEFLAAGGKRIRPVLALVGWYAAGANGEPDTARHLAASLELFHAFALIHDDVIDRSATRRGRPTVHRAQAALGAHRSPANRPRRQAAADRFGEGAAVLIGDLALIWSDELLQAGRPSPAQLERLVPLLNTMRSEVILGQYLDLDAATCQHTDVESALAVIRYKTAKYTIERPLQLGAALAGADGGLMETLSAYAIPLGEAFQLRDDLLGLFGSPGRTGKPVLDDLREGKSTVLIALALQRATPEQGDRLRAFLGCPALTRDQAETARRIIEATRARHTVEHMITERYEQAVAVLEGSAVAGPIADALRRLARRATRRAA
ncbi:polyprenyl synthetase family protein [Streptomyces amakusaensis]|uniref:Polyprenyl synthetase family protein n=1 Tax=Streptomyces amakusaensis TaxID=67271 RepID=A0ABW0ANG3_9ACTN